LGHRFFTNGDFGALLVGPKVELARDDGPPVTAWIDLWQHDRLYLMETGAFAAGRLWSFAVMGFDDAPGRIVRRLDGRIEHVHDPARGAAFHGRRMARLRELADAAGARLLAPPDFVTRRAPATFHPLGGAAISESPETGVADPFGEVFGYPGLFIADGSLLPTPTGAPPSMTIAALAEHVAEHVIRHA
jgi:cholesterol oxidase